jgi:hypothetical protein
MALPVSIPNTFANATTSIPLANLDANFTTIYNAVNGIGNGSESLANVTIAGGIISNVTLDNVTVDVETLTNVTITNLTADGTVDMANATAATIGNANITSVSVAFPNSFLANSNVTIGNTVVSLGDTITTINDTTLANANVASGNVTVTTVADQYGNVRRKRWLGRWWWCGWLQNKLHLICTDPNTKNFWWRWFCRVCFYCNIWNCVYRNGRCWRCWYWTAFSISSDKW